MTTSDQPGLADLRHTYTSLAEASIRQMVIDGRLAPGERLNEVALAGTLQVSRGPIREAIQRLASAGLLRVVSHRGAYVRSWGRDELRNLYDLRIALETYAVRVGAKRASNEQLDELREMLTQTELVLQEKSDRYPSELDFHRRIVALAGNPDIDTAFESALSQIVVARARSSSDAARIRVALSDHRDVLTHVVARNGERAATSLRKHLEGALDNALTVLDLDD